MRRAQLVPLLFSGVAVAAPRPQDIPFDLAIAAPDPTYTISVGAVSQSVVYDTASIISEATAVSSMTVAVTDVVSSAIATATDPVSTLARRADCAALPKVTNDAPAYSPDAASAFLAQTAFAATASAAPTPSGYDVAFIGMNASSQAYGYLGFINLPTYDVNTCAQKCSTVKDCMAINIYYERDPTVSPASGCPNPASQTLIKCVFWGGPVTKENTWNSGQYQSQFQVVIAGSNGYVNQNLRTPAGYTALTYLGDAAINAPYDTQGYNTYMGAKFFSAGPFNAQLCADACTAQNKYNIAYPPNDGSPVQLCQFFNTYLTYINKTSNVQGQVCAMYSEAWPTSYATNTGQYRGADLWKIMNSYTFTNATSPGAPNKVGAIYQARNEIKANTLQPYCSSLLGYTTAVTTVTSTSTTTPLTTTFTTSTSTELTYTTTTTTAPAVVIFSKRVVVPSSAPGTPAVLTKYPGTVIASACSLIATPVASTSTSTTVTVTTAPASVSTVATVTTTTSTSISTVVTQSAAASPAAAQPTCGSVLNTNYFGSGYTLGNVFITYAAAAETAVDSCKATTGCKSFGLVYPDSSSVQFALFSLSTADLLVAAAGTGTTGEQTVYWDVSCGSFDGITEAPAPATTTPQPQLSCAVQDANYFSLGARLVPGTYVKAYPYGPNVAGAIDTDCHNTPGCKSFGYAWQNNDKSTNTVLAAFFADSYTDLAAYASSAGGGNSGLPTWYYDVDCGFQK